MTTHLAKLHLFTAIRGESSIRQYSSLYLRIHRYAASIHMPARLTSRFYVSRVLINFRWPARMCWPLALLVTRSSALKFFCQKVLRNVCRISEEVTWWFGCTAYYQTHTAILSLDLRNTAQLLQHGSSTANIRIITSCQFILRLEKHTAERLCLRIW